jgi:hypothetical protein
LGSLLEFWTRGDDFNLFYFQLVAGNGVIIDFSHGQKEKNGTKKKYYQMSQAPGFSNRVAFMILASG